MTWPPSAYPLSTNNINDQANTDTHPALHNDANASINDIVGLFQFVGSSATDHLFEVSQGSGTIENDSSSYGWQHVILASAGGPISVYMAWGIIKFGPATSGESGQPVICDFGPFLNKLDTSTFGFELRGGPGLPVGHSVVKIGGVLEPEPYHVVVQGSSVGGTVAHFVGPDGAELGVDAALASDDEIEFQLSCFIFTD